MSDANNQPLNELLSGFSLGPSWAKGNQDGKSKSGPDRLMSRKPSDKRDSSEPRGDRDRRDGRGSREDGPRFSGRDRRDNRSAPPLREEVRPAPGVTVQVIPAPEAIQLIGKEIIHEARVYPLFDVAQTLLAERGRCRAVFESPEPHPFLWRGLLDESLFLTKEEAARHLWSSALRARFIDEETIDTDPPKGNFTTVARCGMSGEWLGPPNFHAYQGTLRRIHRERFPHVPFESYTARVRMEKGEEAINEWLATMTKKTRWHIHGTPGDAWIDDEAVVRREVILRFFEEAFEEARCVEVSAAIPASHISPSLMLSMKQAGNHAKEHPAYFIPPTCKALESEHFPVFKRKGKLYTGPARPHPLPPDQILAERPSVIVEWIRNNNPAKLEGLWQAVSPEGSTAPPAEYAADLYWLLQQGHILLHLDDSLVVQEVRSATPPPDSENPPANKGNKKRKKNTRIATGARPPEATANDGQTTSQTTAEPPSESTDAGTAEAGADAPSTPPDSTEPLTPDAPASAIEVEPGPSPDPPPQDPALHEPTPPAHKEEIPDSSSPGVDEPPVI